MTFTYCVQDFGGGLPSASFDYIVLKLDESCPLGSYPFARHHDTEDDNPNNKYTGNIYPNDIGNNATLEYCFVPKSSSTPKYPFSKDYGVFAKPSPAISGLTQYELYVDDEDDIALKMKSKESCVEAINSAREMTRHCGKKFDLIFTQVIIPWYTNTNTWLWYNVTPGAFPRKIDKQTPDDIKKRISEIMYGGENTTYNAVKWNGTALKKNVSKIDRAETAAEISTPVVAKATLAAVKGVSREAVSVDLQSAGDVEVSLVDVNGHVYAKVSANSLQPGVASLNWNAASVPAGRYIVSVKHNGTISGKNVLLK